MEKKFVLPEGLVGRFAVVKLWPEMKTAEDECIARLKIASAALGIECVEVDARGCFLDDKQRKANNRNVDFVLHLHYDTPKAYDAFSIVALWNPVEFYHQWGYGRCSRNLTSHDDFISCSSDAADDHVVRMIRKSPQHLPPFFNLYHSVSDVVYEPSLGAGKLFYAGINWDVLTGGVSRHQEVLKKLDSTGMLRIYGPRLFQGVQVWAGYESYVREVPFDGVSMIDEIAQAGIALVLSSQAHKDSELMSNRLFESVAAGALVICDENRFAKKFFGDALLYIDSRAPIDQIFSDIKTHIEWANNNKEAAIELIKKAQGIFNQRFTLRKNIEDIYVNLHARKGMLREAGQPKEKPQARVGLCFLMPEFCEKTLANHLESAGAQEYANCNSVIVVDSASFETDKKRILSQAQLSGVDVEIRKVDFFHQGLHAEMRTRRRLGEVLLELIESSTSVDAIIFVAPNERLFSNHVAVLAGALQRDETIACSATAALLENGDAPIHGVHELIDFGHVNREGPPGYGRFIFRMSATPRDIGSAIKYLDGRPLAVLCGDAKIAQLMPSSIVIDVSTDFPERTWNEAFENEVIRHYSPDAFNISTGFTYHPPQSVCASVVDSQSESGSRLRFFSLSWVKAQLAAIKDQGLEARLAVLKRKCGL